MWPFKKQLVVTDAETKALTSTRGGVNAFALDNLINFASGMGTHRDQSTYGRYLPDTQIDRMTADAIFGSSWLGKRVITTIADDMVREWRNTMWDGSQDDDGIFDIIREEERVQVPKRVHTALKWGRQFGGAILVMITKDALTRGALAEPLDVERVKKGDLLNLVSYDRWRIYGTPPDKRDYSNADILVPYLNQTLDDPNYGYPEHYYLSDTSVKIHHSRCIRFDGDELSWYEWSRNAMWHASAYKSILKSLMSYDALMAGCATMVNQANLDIMSLANLTDFLGTDEGTAQLLKRYEMLNLMKSLYGLVVLDKEQETLDRKPLTALTGVTDLCNRFALDVSGAAGVSLTHLFGQPMTGFSNGENDITNDEARIKARQKSNLSPQMAQLDQVLVRSALGRMPDDYRSVWNPLRQQDDGDQATNELKRAQRDAAYIDRKVVTREAAARELRAAGTLTNFTQDDIDAAKKADEDAAKAPPAPPPPIPGMGKAANALGLQPTGEEGNVEGEPGAKKKPNGAKPSALS